ncbi:MAG: DNA-binding protein WhiA [Oscillospiraceae bacterium]|jgi:DNA-binding protein WhiA|nr:DNA-binding protein WhiA [Oscillospiraceae bacterium]
MSFSSLVKAELIAAAAAQDVYCAEAQLYGMLLFARAFSAREIRFTTESAALAELFCAGLRELVPVEARLRKAGRKWDAEITNAADCARVLRRFGHAETDVHLHINRMNLSAECCPAAFLRGSFLACAAISAPQRQYHLEFNVRYRRLAGDLAKLLEEQALQPGLIHRKGAWLLYFKGSEQIEDLLALLGAQRASLDLMGVKIEKDVRNHVNRRVNFETANLRRTAGAAAAQLEAIRQLRACGALDALPALLREAADLRADNPGASLHELSELAAEETTRSGMNHRLKRLVELAAKINPDGGTA